MPPIRNAVRLVNDEQTHTVRDVRQYVVAELVVCQPLRGYEQDVDPILPQVPLDHGPIVRVRAVDRCRPKADAIGGIELIPHQGKQRRDQQTDAGSCVPQQSRGEEIHHALAPTGALHHQQAAPGKKPFNALPLSRPKVRIRPPQRRTQIAQGTFSHGTPIRS
jgi:hypothetical protein